MSTTSDSFVEFGGHTGAGGFSVTLESLITLEEKLSQALSGLKMGEVKLEPSLLDINLSDIGEDLWNLVSSFAPFGMANKKPTFKIAQAEIKSVKKFGKENNHLEVTFNDGNREVKAISFFSSPDAYASPLIPGVFVSLIANLEKSYFRNRPELRLRIVDIKP
jgi:single-stranded-DNA-specific exonuclease